MSIAAAAVLRVDFLRVVLTADVVVDVHATERRDEVGAVDGEQLRVRGRAAGKQAAAL